MEFGNGKKTDIRIMKPILSSDSYQMTFIVNLFKFESLTRPLSKLKIYQPNPEKQTKKKSLPLFSLNCIFRCLFHIGDSPSTDP